MRKISIIYASFLFLILSCNKESNPLSSPDTQQTIAKSTQRSAVVETTVIENFETGSKPSYTTGNVSLATGSWTLNDALLGNTSSDKKNGSQSVRMRNSGILSNNFDFTTGVSTVSISHAIYGTDAASTWQLWYSSNGGSSYTQSGATITTSSSALQVASFTINITGNVRFQVRKTDGSTNRINFDDFSVTSYSGSVTAPALSAISPGSAIAGSAAFTITATGTDFTSSSVINWNHAALTTTYVNATSLTAVVPASNIASVGTDSITVSTSGAGITTARAFFVQSTPAPVLSSVSPNTVIAGGSAFTLTVIGNNFTNNSVVNWNNAALVTTYISTTSLTVAVPAININAPGTASITITNGTNVSSPVILTITTQTSGTKKFLFDATKAETSGNGDWVIDEDNSPQRVPTPAQSTITSSTSETYWKGALSSWGIALVKSGNFVETLPSGTAISYGNSSNAQDLSHYDVFVVDEPNTRFTAVEKTAILNFVRNGGGLFMISDHTVSDRNNDGWDSPDIWNDLMTNNTVQNNPFGFSIDLTNISQISTNVLTNSSNNPILHGIKGVVTKLQFNNGATLSLQPSVNSTVQGLIWQNTYAQGNTHVMAASSTFGNGRVFVVTDSSPMDDGTGASGNTLYVSWPLYSHTQLFMNASTSLAKLQ
ncbi:MAG: hypothetical protein ABI402_06725 [Ferruginibacter sp.]